MKATAHKLSNGMIVILEENRVRPVISFNALVKVGSAFETDKEAGMCHVIEHMLFKGTPTYPVGEIARNIEAAGGDINAYTSFDQTVFYINMASMFADKGLAILVDAIRNPLFDPEELESEKEVILEEIRREKDHPARMISELLFNHTYTKHTYGRPIIGFPNTVKSFTHKDLIKFYRKWYTPQNMAFVVVGDFETKKMLNKLNKLFAGFRGPPPPKIAPLTKKEPTQKKVRLIVESANIQNVHFAMAWHIPNIVHKDVPALDVTSHILGGSDSSRLEQQVKERKRLVHQIHAYAYTPRDPGILAISGIMGDAQVPHALEAIRKEIELLQQEPAQAAELSRAKLNIRSSEIYEKETVGGQSGKLAYFLATAGSHEFEERYYQILQDVHADDVRRVAGEYLPTSNLTAVLLVPNRSPWFTQRAKLEKILDSRKPIAKARKKKAQKIVDLHKIKLKNGLTLVVKENHHLPLVSMCAATLGGLRYEKPSNNGISNLMAHLFTKGTKTRSAVRIAKDIEKIAGHIEGYSAKNSSGLKCEFLSEYLRDGFSLFGDILTHPAWNAAEVSNEKRILLNNIKDQEDSLGTMTFIHFLKALYPKHPYGLRSSGSIKAVKSLKGRDIERFYHSAFCPSNMILSVVGDVNPSEIVELADEFLVDLPKGKCTAPKIKTDPKPKEPRTVVKHKKEKQQAHIVLGFQGTMVKSKDRYAFTVLNNVLAGQGGRLFLTLRDKMGLAYVVSSINQEGIEPGYFAVYMGTEPSKVDTAIEGIKKELSDVITKPIHREELERAKQYIVGTYELESQRNGALSSTYALNELYGLGIDEVEKYPEKIMAVKGSDAAEVARKYIDLNAPVLSIIKPA